MSIRGAIAIYATREFLAARLTNAPASRRELLKSRLAIYARMEHSTPREQISIWKGVEITAPPKADDGQYLSHLPAVSCESSNSDGVCRFEIEGEIAFRDDPEHLASRASGATTINVGINSVGGSGAWAHTFGRALRKTKARIVADIQNAYSAATLIAQYADVRRIRADGSMMIHAGQFACLGSAEDFRRVAAWLDTFSEEDTALLCNRTGQPRKVVESWLSKDTYFTPEEALALGIVDEIISSPP